MKIKNIYYISREKLKENDIDEYDIKLRILLCYVLKIRKEELIIKLEDEIDGNFENEFNKYVDKLKSGVPIQYITNKQEFMKLDFYVDENVLIPQPDTEILVEETIKLAKNGDKIIDMCTGSGAIAVALSKYVENVNVVAADISQNALDIANKNAKNNNVKIEFIKSDLFDKIEENDFDIIVSNPPYIKSDVINELSSEVKYEPIIALDGGEDGLYFYKEIAKNAKRFLKENGYLCLEIGYDQKNDVEEILKQEGYKEIKCIKDLNNNDRVVIAMI